MKQTVFAVYDTAAHAYLPPFFLPSVDMAVRVFSDCVNSPDHQFGKHPEDYTLFRIAEWDNLDAQFHPDKASIATGSELVQKINTAPELSVDTEN